MSIAGKNEAVLNVLRAATEPLGPTRIAELIGQPWCSTGHYGCSASIVPVLRRVGAVRHEGGKYTLPSSEAAQS